MNKKRGWDALEERLKKRGMTNIQIEEAKDSFYKGIEVLAKLFLSEYSTEKRT